MRTALMAIQQELKAPKGQYNSFGKYKYRSAEDILEAVKPLCAKYECLLTLSDELLNIGDRYYIKATASISDSKGGGATSVTAYAREDETKKGMDGSQITGTASSYARKYALNGLFLIDDTKDADTDAYREQQNSAAAKPNNGTGTPTSKDRMLDQIRKLAKKHGVAENDICAQAAVEKLEDMPGAQVVSCLNWLKGM